MSVDCGTELVQAYLQANGYFTVVDYPLVEFTEARPPRSVTDVDLLAVRFPGHDSSHAGSAGRRVRGPVASRPDPMLACPRDRTDMIVAEVKRGLARPNPASRNPKVLEAALTRFGCCNTEDSETVVRALLRNGSAVGSHGHIIRMVLFASHGEHAPAGWHLVYLADAILFLEKFLQHHRGQWQSADFHDPALAWLSLVHKCRLTLRKETT